MAAYSAGANQLDIKRHGICDAFWVYITAPCIVKSPVARALAAATMVLFVTCHNSMLVTCILPNYLCLHYLTLYLVTHGCGLTSPGFKAGPGPGVNVSDSERMTCYSTLYIV